MASLASLATLAVDVVRRAVAVNGYNYRLWKTDPHHPGLQFRRVGRRYPAFSVRVGIGWRALGVRQADTMVWFWIGSHAEYDRLLNEL